MSSALSEYEGINNRPILDYRDKIILVNRNEIQKSSSRWVKGPYKKDRR
jgi:hypothetical protein